MATLAALTVSAHARRHWFREFLREELEPYPERVQLAGRMVLAATLVMIVCMAFRIPYSFQGALFALMISRESTRATLSSVWTIFVAMTLGAIFVFCSAQFFTVNPVLHFLWIGIALFLVFFALSTINNYIGVLMFAILIVVAIPFWDRAIPPEVNVEDTLWLVWSSFVGAGITLLVELAFARLRPGDNVIIPLAERLCAVEAVLRCYAEAHPVTGDAIRQIKRYAMLGTSLARRNSQRSGFSLPYVALNGGVISLVGTLVDTTAGLTQMAAHPSDDERRRARELADHVGQIRSDFLARRFPAPIRFHDLDADAPGLPLLPELEETVELIPQVFVAPPRPEDDLRAVHPPSSPMLAHDAFTNPAHLQFAVKGIIASMLCYVLYTSVDWPGISTAVTTCVLTALTTIGSSRQKQVLRITGALVGGFIFGIGAQIFVLPYVDTIFGFTVLFVIVTAVSTWFMTASPRLSYFGVQIAAAYYLIHLQEFRFQTSLGIARDRAVGVLLGLFAMWLTFDQLWGRPASADMKTTFIANLRLLAQLAREPDLGDRKYALRRIYALGQTINTGFDQVKSLADGVLFEFGRSRASDLALRARITQWQSRLRALFLVRGAMLRYRLGVAGFELPPEMEPAQKQFDHELSETLDGMAECLEGNPAQRTANLDQALSRVENDAAAHPSPHLNDFLALCRTETQLALSVSRKCHL